LAVIIIIFFFSIRFEHNDRLEARCGVKTVMSFLLFLRPLSCASSSSSSILVRNQHHNHGDDSQPAQKVHAQMTAENKAGAERKGNLGTGVILVRHAFSLWSSGFTFCLAPREVFHDEFYETDL
jgi:hypothetical protein